MSAPAQTQHDSEGEGEKIAFGKVVGIGVVSLLIFAIGILWSIQIQKNTEKEFQPEGHQALPFPPEKYEVGMVNLKLFKDDPRTDDYLRAQRKRLSSYGWVDKEKGLIHTPVEKAMEALVQEAGQ